MRQASRRVVTGRRLIGKAVFALGVAQQIRHRDDILAGSVVRGHDGRWRLYYTGSHFLSADTNSNIETIGLAVSDDLFNWTPVSPALIDIGVEHIYRERMDRAQRFIRFR